MKKIIMAVLAITAGSVHAADFTGLQAFRAADIEATAERHNAQPPTPAKSETGAVGMKGLSEAKAVEQIPTSLYIEGAYGGVKAHLRLDIRPGAAPRKPAVAEVTVSGHGVQIGEVPQLAVTSIKVYEMGTGRLAAAFSNPRPENNFFSCEKRFHVFRLEIPRENLDLAGQYTFVAALSVNGSLAWDVRSEFGKIEIRN